MPRPAKFTSREILDAAARLVAVGGPPAATMGAIAHALRAPSGSIYHRFASRDELLGRLWLDKIAAFQTGALAALAHEPPQEAAIAAAHFVLNWVRLDPEAARIVMTHRRAEFEGAGWPQDMAEEARRLGAALEEGLDAITYRLFGAITPDLRRAARFSIVDIPYAAVRPHIARGEPPPPSLDSLVRAAVIASVDVARRR